MVQARMGSSRLPGKVLRSFSTGQTLLEAVLARLRSSDLEPVVLTTCLELDDPVVSLCDQIDTPCFRGHPDDVLSRFVTSAAAMRLTDQDFVIRACADNPFISPFLARHTTELCRMAPDADYVSLGIDGTPGIRLHTGIFVEGVRIGSLRALMDERDPAIREHVTLGLYQSASRFRIVLKDLCPEWKADALTTRLTIDDEDDWMLCDKLMLLHAQCDFDQLRLILRTDPAAQASMAAQRIKYLK